MNILTAKLGTSKSKLGRIKLAFIPQLGVVTGPVFTGQLATQYSKLEYIELAKAFVTTLGINLQSVAQTLTITETLTGRDITSHGNVSNTLVLTETLTSYLPTKHG